MKKSEVKPEWLCKRGIENEQPLSVAYYVSTLDYRDEREKYESGDFRECAASE